MSHHSCKTPEWKKAYMFVYIPSLKPKLQRLADFIVNSDYRALKKRINAIRRAQGENPNDSDSPAGLSDQGPGYESFPEDRNPDDCSIDEHCDDVHHRPIRVQLRRQAGISFISFATTKTGSTVNDSCADSISDTEPYKEADLAVPPEHGFPSSPIAIAFNDMSQPVVIADHMSHPIRTRPMSPVTGVLPLRELLPLLSHLERLFFSDLDRELEKVENFYLDREKQMRTRSMMLEEQLAELFEHQVVHVRASSLFMYARVNCSLILNLCDREGS
jgi:hypothetical protein